jgi:hypothetical protein
MEANMVLKEKEMCVPINVDKDTLQKYPEIITANAISSGFIRSLVSYSFCMDAMHDAVANLIFHMKSGDDKAELTIDEYHIVYAVNHQSHCTFGMKTVYPEFEE